MVDDHLLSQRLKASTEWRTLLLLLDSVKGWRCDEATSIMLKMMWEVQSGDHECNDYCCYSDMDIIQ